jgi:hypothetical protein
VELETHLKSRKRKPIDQLGPKQKRRRRQELTETVKEIQQLRKEMTQSLLEAAVNSYTGVGSEEQEVEDEELQVSDEILTEIEGTLNLFNEFNNPEQKTDKEIKEEEKMEQVSFSLQLIHSSQAVRFSFSSLFFCLFLLFRFCYRKKKLNECSNKNSFTEFPIQVLNRFAKQCPQQICHHNIG